MTPPRKAANGLPWVESRKAALKTLQMTGMRMDEKAA
jgi:hypothetical protein